MNRKLTDERGAEMAGRIAAGHLSYRKARDEYGVSIATVQWWVKKCTMPVLPSTPAPVVHRTPPVPVRKPTPAPKPEKRPPYNEWIAKVRTDQQAGVVPPPSLPGPAYVPPPPLPQGNATIFPTGDYGANPTLPALNDALMRALYPDEGDPMSREKVRKAAGISEEELTAWITLQEQMNNLTQE